MQAWLIVSVLLVPGYCLQEWGSPVCFHVNFCIYLLCETVV